MTKQCYFMDTSALFKRYVEESGSNVVNRLLGKEDACYISILTLCEVISNLKRLVEIDGLLSDDEFKMVKSIFLNDIGNGYLQTLDVGPQVILSSLEICSTRYITPLDAIQLATVLSMNEANPVFVCSDVKVNRIAEDLGLEVLNPVQID